MSIMKQTNELNIHVGKLCKSPIQKAVSIVGKLYFDKCIIVEFHKITIADPNPVGSGLVCAAPAQF